jgi:hypothetical protein
MHGQPVRFALWAPLGRADLDGLCRRVARLVGESGARLAVCDASGLPADGVAVDALARLKLVAARCGAELMLAGASEELVGLIALAGLADVLDARAAADPR